MNWFSLCTRHQISDALMNGQDINELDEDGKSLLFYLTDIDAIKTLVENNINLNTVDNMGKSVLFYHSNNEEIIDSLIEYGVSPTIEFIENYPRFLSIYIKHGFDFDEHDVNFDNFSSEQIIYFLNETGYDEKKVPPEIGISYLSEQLDNFDDSSLSDQEIAISLLESGRKFLLCYYIRNGLSFSYPIGCLNVEVDFPYLARILCKIYKSNMDFIDATNQLPVIERKYLLTKTTLFFMQNLFFFLQEIRDNGDTHLIPRAFFLQTRKFLLLNYVSPAEIIDNLQLTEEDFRPLSDCNFYEYADLSYYRVLSCSDFWQRIILPLLES